MTEDKDPPNAEDPSPEACDTGRDARGRWKKGHCPNRKGRPKRKRFKNYDPSDPRHFFSTQIEVMTADGPQEMDRKAAVMHKLFESAMKGGATAQRMVFAMIEKNDRQLAELRLEYERLEAKLIHDNPDFKDLDESLTRQQRIDLLGMATTLNHYYPGQYDAILGKSDDETSKKKLEEILAKLAKSKSESESGSESETESESKSEATPEPKAEEGGSD